MQLSSLRALLMSMTLEEKIGQLTQLPPTFYQPNGDDAKDLCAGDQKIVDLSGSTYGISGSQQIRAVQEYYLKNHRLAIPLLFMADITRGYRTIFPSPLALAASWHPALVQESAQVIARECYVAGLHAIFSPVIDVVTSTNSNRATPGYGEDPYLYAQMIQATIIGLQGATLASDRVAACLGHSTVKSYTQHSDDFAVDVYLCKTAVDAGVKLLMGSANRLDNTPILTNSALVKDLLRREWGFEGVVISSFNVLGELVEQEKDLEAKEVIRAAIKAGLDIDGCSLLYARHLCQLVDTGVINEVLIDAAVWRILLLKNALGLFENPYRGADQGREHKLLLCKEHQKVALNIARESLVLLKNHQGVLPLLSSLTIGVLNADAYALDPLNAVGLQDNLEPAPTLTQALTSYFDEVVSFENVPLALSELESVQVIIIVLKATIQPSGEYGVVLDQIDSLKMLRPLNKPIIGLLVTESGVDLQTVLPYVDGLIVTWLSGHQGAVAVAQTLVGLNNPSAKLPVSFPSYLASSEDLWSLARRDAHGERYLEVLTPQHGFPLGFGLSYSKFIYKDVEISNKSLGKHESLNVTVTVCNISKIEGKEVVQLYIKALDSSDPSHNMQLINFKKIKLLPERSDRITFVVDRTALRFMPSDAREFTLMVGFSSQQGYYLNFHLID